MSLGHATEVAGCFLHEEQPIEDGEVARLLGPGPPPRIEARGRLRLAIRDTGPSPGDTALIGRLGPRGALDRALGTEGQGAERLVEAAYLAWGDGAWLRLAGQFAAAHFDAEDDQLHLVRSPGSASPPWYVVREGRRTYFASQLAPLRSAKRTLDRGLLDAWVKTGVWPQSERTPFTDIEVVAPGTAFLVDARGRNRRHRFWTFTPLVIPRRIDPAEALRELEALIEANISAATLGPSPTVDADSPARELLLRLGRGSDPSPTTTTLASLLDLARSAEGPLARSTLERAASLPVDRSVLVDRGAAACFGASPSARSSLFSTLAQALEANPSPRLLGQVVAEGVALGQARRLPELVDTLGRVVDRWRRHLPAELDRRIDWLPEPKALETNAPVLTGSPFIDRRFHEIGDRTLEVELGLLAQRRKICAPFSDPAVVELLFQLPPELLSDGGRAYSLLGGLPFGGLGDAKSGEEDRAAGLGLYLAALD